MLFPDWKLSVCWLGKGIVVEMSRRQKLVATIHELSRQERPEEAPFWVLAEPLFGKGNCNGKPDPFTSQNKAQPFLRSKGDCPILDIKK